MPRELHISKVEELNHLIDKAELLKDGDVIIIENDIAMIKDLTVNCSVTIQLYGENHSFDTNGYLLKFNKSCCLL